MSDRTNNVTETERSAKRYVPPPESQDESGAAGPGLPGWCPLPESDDAPAPNAPDDLLATIAQDTEAILDRCAAKVEELERLYECAPAQLYQQARTRLAAARANSATP